MSAERPIDVVRERLADLVEVLKRAKADRLAAQLQTFEPRFSQVTDVRRAVAELSTLLERMRVGAVPMPSSASAQVAANHLEDACRAALKGGVIAPAAPTIAAQAKRKTKIIVATVAAGLLAVLIPTAFVALGFGVDDLTPAPPMGPIAVVRGGETRVTVIAPTSPAVEGVRVTPRYRLAQPCEASADPDVLSCAPAKLADASEHEGGVTYELRHVGQAQGLFVTLPEPHMQSDRGVIRLGVRADARTPLGHYAIPLQAGYAGYGDNPECPPLQKYLRLCPHLKGRGMVDEAIPEQTVIIDVQRASDGAAQGLREAVGAVPAALELPSLDELEAELGEVEAKLAEDDYLEASSQLSQVRGAMAALDRFAMERPEEAPSPDALEMVRLLVQARSDQLQEFEARVYEAWFKKAHPRRAADREPVDLGRLAKKFETSKEHVAAILARYDDETARREQQVAQAHAEEEERKEHKLVERCGPLPKSSWAIISEYLRKHHDSPTTTHQLKSCLTPRLSESRCWGVTCEYQRTSRREDGTRYGAHLRATFDLRRGHVTRLSKPRD